MKNKNHRVILLLSCSIVTILMLTVFPACSSAPAPAPATTPTPGSSPAAPAPPPAPAATSPAPATPGGQSININLIAQNMAFDQKTITVTAGASVTMVFNNKESAPHNFALYNDSSVARVIFKGDVISSSTITYKFNAPSTPGTYFFRCDVHPTSMTGSFIVK